MFILNDMQKADIVEVIQVVVDDVDNKGGVEGKTGEELLQKLSVASQCSIPWGKKRGENSFKIQFLQLDTTASRFSTLQIKLTKMFTQGRVRIIKMEI